MRRGWTRKFKHWDQCVSILWWNKELTLRLSHDPNLCLTTLSRVTIKRDMLIDSYYTDIYLVTEFFIGPTQIPLGLAMSALRSRPSFICVTPLPVPLVTPDKSNYLCQHHQSSLHSRPHRRLVISISILSLYRVSPFTLLMYIYICGHYSIQNKPV